MTHEQTRHRREAWAQEKGTKKKSLTIIIIKISLVLVKWFILGRSE